MSCNAAVTTQQIKFVVFNPIFNYSFGIAATDTEHITEGLFFFSSPLFASQRGYLLSSFPTQMSVINSNQRDFKPFVLRSFSIVLFLIVSSLVCLSCCGISRTTDYSSVCFASNLIFCSFRCIVSFCQSVCVVCVDRIQFNQSTSVTSTQQAPRIPAATAGDVLKVSIS